MNNLMNLLLGLKDNSFESFMREKTIKFEPDFKLEETMEESARYAERNHRRTANVLMTVQAAGRNGEKIKPSSKEFKDT